MALAVLSWLGWQYWMSQQRPGLMPTGMAPSTAPEPASAQGEVAAPMEAASLAEAPEAPGSAAADAAVPSVAQVDAAAPVPAAALLATPAAT